mgnify:CR=1 FL=1
MARFKETVVTIPLSGFVSGGVAFTGGTLISLWVPTVTSVQMFVQVPPGSLDQASASWVRLQNALGSGDFTIAAGPGSKAFTLTDVLKDIPYFRFESSLAQSAVRSLALMSKYGDLATGGPLA